ncbi:hypothetical protein QAD02_022715 [Eretmocerus hayati]|uniref:Uncharacterized protein n=1 Tax=Eretmocerus hayati TaxID=131215 RepID=A0ACC2PVW8_9HYME|nr:hypothetical protein QAD02_022715 [Eretmocerus hayati]
MMAAGSEIVTVTSPAPTTTTTQETITTMMTLSGDLISSTLPRITTQPTTDTTDNTMSPSTSGYTDYDDITFAEDIATVVPPASLTKRRKRNTDGYFSSFPDDGFWMQDLDIWPDQTALPTDQRDATELQFLVNGCEATNVPAATYTDVLPFAYFPSLKAVGLEFPLDNPRYNVMLLLPTERTDTNRLSRDLAGQNLRQLRKHLQPSWVRATIPSFMLRGFVTLTPYLQRLGIRDVFEPRLADLTPMTPDLGVYARDVQQSIAVNIKNYMKLDRENATKDSNTTSNNGTSGQSTGPSAQPPRSAAYRFLRPANDLLDRMGIVTFTAGHPFLFFIVDSETSVSLIAGRIDNPLNSRIL